MSRPASFAVILVLVAGAATAQTSNPRAASKRRTAPAAAQALEPSAALGQPSGSPARSRAARPAVTAAPVQTVAPAATDATPGSTGVMPTDAQTGIVTTRIWRGARRIGLPTIGPRFPVGPASPIR
jgi:hypothetical protein